MDKTSTALDVKALLDLQVLIGQDDGSATTAPLRDAIHGQHTLLLFVRNFA